MRISKNFDFAIDPLQFIEQNEGCISYLNGNEKSKEKTIAWGIQEEIVLHESDAAFEKLREFYDLHRDWMFGFLAYDLKNDTEKLHSSNSDELKFPLLHFYVPKLLIQISENTTRVEFNSGFPSELLGEMMLKARKAFVPSVQKKVEMVFHGMEESDYVSHFDSLIKHIQKGDIYEVNYCLDFKAKDIIIDPISTYYHLNEQTEAPFSLFYRNKEHFILSGSPERYIKKEGKKILSQPIKGTAKRGADEEEDKLLKEKLRHDPKEQAENVMIVDLVRNDLSKIAEKSSVKVDELFGVYTFKTVHQLISSISCVVKDGIHPIDIIKASFPMGSMTGAPKIRAMKIIEAHEDFKRSVYSGSFGYFKPNGDFDFNVIIRSILYNEKRKVLSFPVGGAITSLAKGVDEYNECILKAKAMKNALQSS